MLSYEEYIKYGGKLDKPTFENYSFDAFAKINAATHGRIKEPSEAVKRCLKKLIDIIAKFDITNDNVSSWSNDGVSQSFVSISAEEQEKEIKKIIYNYLINETDNNGVPLLYLGVSV